MSDFLGMRPFALQIESLSLILNQGLTHHESRPDPHHVNGELIFRKFLSINMFVIINGFGKNLK